MRAQVSRSRINRGARIAGALAVVAVIGILAGCTGDPDQGAHPRSAAQVSTGPVEAARTGDMPVQGAGSAEAGSAEAEAALQRSAAAQQTAIAEVAAQQIAAADTADRAAAAAKQASTAATAARRAADVAWAAAASANIAAMPKAKKAATKARAAASQARLAATAADESAQQARQAAASAATEPEAAETAAAEALSAAQAADAATAAARVAAANARTWAKRLAARYAKCPAEARACVDLTNNMSWLQDDGEIVYGPVRITSGRPGFLTHPGMWRVFAKHRSHVSSYWGTSMPNSVFFDPVGIAFHQGSLNELSHGCIHLSWKASERYWDYLSGGDRVFVFGAARY